MFLRQLGKKVLLLRSYRDGAGKVRQRCLAKFGTRVVLTREWDALEVADPGLKVELRELRGQALDLVTKLESPPDSIETKVIFHSKALLRLLSEYGPQETPELVLLREYLQSLSACETLRCSINDISIQSDDRTCKNDKSGKTDEDLNNIIIRDTPSISDASKKGFDLLSTANQGWDVKALGPKVFGAQAYVEALKSARLDPTVSQFKRQQRGHRVRENRLDTLKEIFRIRPDLEGTTSYAMALAQEGQVQECLNVLFRLPGGDAWSNFNRAAVFWKLQEPLLSLTYVLKGLTKETELLRALQSLQKGQNPLKGALYWEKFGSLWDDDSRNFLLRLFKQPLIQLRLRSVKEGDRMRTLLHPHFHHRLLQRIFPGLHPPP